MAYLAEESMETNRNWRERGGKLGLSELARRKTIELTYEWETSGLMASALAMDAEFCGSSLPWLLYCPCLAQKCNKARRSAQYS